MNQKSAFNTENVHFVSKQVREWNFYLVILIISRKGVAMLCLVRAT